MAVVGYFLTGIHARIRKLCGKKTAEEAYIGETATERYSQRKILWLRMLLPLGMFVITGLFVVIMNRFFSPTKMIGTEQFTDAMTINGYNTSDTTDELRQEWKIGSLLKESCSVQNQNIRIDFCVMDSSGSAKRLYKAMRLLGSDGDKDNNGSDFYWAENAERYAVKIRVEETLLYAVSEIGSKEELIELLKAIGYWE